MKQLSGAAASPGIAIGPAFVITETDIEMPEYSDPASAFSEAASAVATELQELQQQAAAAEREEAAAVLGAQALMAEDPMLGDGVSELLATGTPLDDAITTASQTISSTLATLDDEYLAARSADILEVAERIRYRLAGVEQAGLDSMTAPAVVVATALTAADTAGMDAELVVGFVTEQGGPTGHVAVIARSLGIPAVVATPGATAQAADAQTVALDGGTGEVVLDPDDAAAADFEQRQRDMLARAAIAEQYRSKRVSFGAVEMRIAGNVGNTADVQEAVASGADGIGLYRTEFLFLDRAEPPTEEEQYEAYAAAVEAFDHPVVIRTLDIGGDKPAPYLTLPEEENPFLGVRAVRLYEEFGHVFRSQVRALLRASALGDLWIMVPMIATTEDWEGVAGLIDTYRAELTSEGVTIGEPKLGVMIEVPAAALIASHLARHVDFFSIGTNDLTQYIMAADRTHGGLHRYADAAHPAVLSLCAATAVAATGAGISVAVCGEAAADPVTALLFAAMGMDKLSVTPRAVGIVKATIDRADHATAQSALEAALAARSASDVRDIVARLIDDS